MTRSISTINTSMIINTFANRKCHKLKRHLRLLLVKYLRLGNRFLKKHLKDKEQVQLPKLNPLTLYCL